MKKLLLIVVLSAVILANAMAVPAYNGIMKKVLPDGSTIELTLHGDEYFSYYTTVDGYLVKQMDDGYYQYATMKGGIIEPNGVRCRNAEDRSAEDVEMLERQGVFRMSAADFGRIRNRSVKMRKKSEEQRVSRGTSGQEFEKNLVLLVNFADRSFTRTNAEFANQFNQTGYSVDGATGSVKEYFADNSYGQFSPEFDVYGPVTLDNNMAYYGANDYNGDDVRPAQMVLDAVRKLHQSQTINWADYDCDNDGYIDNMIIYYAGYGENMGADDDCVWPHQWYVASYSTDIQSDADRTFGGKILAKYICMNELYGTSGAQMCGIGTFCHEFSHALGLMDLYVTDYSSNHKTVGYWDLMCSGSYNNRERTPAGYSMFERFYVGWSEPTLLNAPATIEMQSTMDGNESYIVTRTGGFDYDPISPTPNEYYIFENRQKKRWDAYLPGNGMLVEKITWDYYAWASNVGNNDPDNMVVDIIEAGHSTNPDGSASDPFPGSNYVTQFSPYSQYPLTDIRETNGVISFDFMGGAAVGPFTVYFNAGENGVSDTAKLTQGERGSVIVLPGATSSEGLEFAGWSYEIEAEQVDAGVEGEGFVPQGDVLLNAVYKENGMVVPNSWEGCFAERFSKLGNDESDVTNSIDRYADNKGWTGSRLMNKRGVLQIGSEGEKGSIVTPALGLMGDLDVTVVVRQEAMSYIGVVSEDEMAADYALVDGMGVAYLHLKNVTPNSKLVISSDLDVFSMTDIFVCGDAISEAEEEVSESRGAVLVRSSVRGGLARVERLDSGARVRVVDALGRVLLEDTVEGDVYEFVAPECFYMVEVVNNNNREVLK